jgi:hypothetical protein
VPRPLRSSQRRQASGNSSAPLPSASSNAGATDPRYLRDFRAHRTCTTSGLNPFAWLENGWRGLAVFEQMNRRPRDRLATGDTTQLASSMNRPGLLDSRQPALTGQKMLVAPDALLLPWRCRLYRSLRAEPNHKSDPASTRS